MTLTPDQIAHCLAVADETLRLPPRWPWTERHDGRGHLLLRFVLPLELVPTSNVGVRHRQSWALAKERQSVLACMAPQLLRQSETLGIRCAACSDGRSVRPMWPAPREGRPMLRAIRFSSRQPDDTAAWWKVPGDVLLGPRRLRSGRHVAGFGVLVADDPRHLETRAWGEYAARGEGFALIEIWSGAELPSLDAASGRGTVDGNPHTGGARRRCERPRAPTPRRQDLP